MKFVKPIILILFLVIAIFFYILSGEKQKTDNTNPTPTTTNQVIDKQNSPVQTAPIKESNPQETKQIPDKKTQIKQVKEIQSPNISFSWKDLNIKPVPTPEGTYYTFTAFDMAPNNSLVITGRFNKKNIVRFIDKDKKKDVLIPGDPLDILTIDKTTYVLSLQAIYVIKNYKIVQQFPLKDPNIAFFDKLLSFDNQPFVLMSDGSAYKITPSKPVKQKALTGLQGNEIWVVKTGKNSFNLKENPCTTLCMNVSYPNEIGSITIAGGNSNNIFLCIDKFSKDHSNIYRAISQSQSGFKDEIIRLQTNQYSYIKNDYRIKNDTIFYVKIDEKGLTIQKQKIN